VAEELVGIRSKLAQHRGKGPEEVRERTTPYMKGGRLDVRGVRYVVILHRIRLSKPPGWINQTSSII